MRAHICRSAEAEHREAAAVGDVRIGDGLPGGRQNIGEVDEAIVRRSVGNLDRAEVSLRHTQELGLAAGDLTVHLRVPEQRCALAVVTHLRGLALGVELLITHVALPAGDVERDHDAIAGMDVRHPVTDGLDHPDRFVTEDVALVEKRSQHLVQVQVQPQIPVEVTRTIASVGCSMRGSGTLSTRTSRRPWNVTAFIADSGEVR